MAVAADGQGRTGRRRDGAGAKADLPGMLHQGTLEKLGGTSRGMPSACPLGRQSIMSEVSLLMNSSEEE